MYQTERLHDQALAYLLDELSTTERQAFEMRLDQPEVADALQHASELVLQLSELPWDQPPAAKRNTLSKPSVPARTKTPNALHWKRLLTIAAAALIVATLAMLAQQGENQQANQSDTQGRINQPAGDMQWQLAMQLADPAVRWNQKDSNTELSNPSSQEPEWAESVNATDDETNESGSADESLDWMVLAVQAQLESGEQDES